jgi:DNA-directed RNA polymerase II subunit RPB1
MLQVLVQNGELLTGRLCKRSLGTSAGSLLHIVVLEKGSQMAGVMYHGELKNILSESWCHKSSRNYFVRELVSQKLKKLFCQRFGVTKAQENDIVG